MATVGAFRGDRLGLLLCVGALFACGVKTWSVRPGTPAIRALSVDETQLFAGDAACTSTLRVQVAAACAKRGTPIEVSVAGTRVATLARPARAEVAPMPKNLRPSYTKEGKDETRLHVDIPLPAEGAEVSLKSRALAHFGKPSSVELVSTGTTLEVSPELAASCRSLNVEVECN